MVKKALLTVALCSVLVAASGCGVFGFLAYVAPKPNVAPEYKGLAGQTVAVMVWVDRGIRIDNPLLALDIANGVEQNLIAAQKDKKDELELAKFPVEPRSVIRYQAEHPEIDGMPIMEVAPILNVSRVIYIEVNDFATRPDASLELFRGSILVSMKVIEVDNNGKPTLAFQHNDVRVVYPDKVPAQGLPNSNDIATYQGVVTELTKQLAEEFYTHRPKDD